MPASQSHAALAQKTLPFAGTLPPFFNMLSEGENRKLQSQLLHIDAADDFGILLATARYDTIGAVTVKPIEP